MAVESIKDIVIRLLEDKRARKIRVGDLAVHPDDFAELRAAFLHSGELVYDPLCDGQRPMFNGVNLIVDHRQPRLPRREMKKPKDGV